MDPEESKQQINRPVVGCFLIVLGIGVLGFLLCVLAILYSASFGDYRSVENWIFKVGFVAFVIFGIGVVGLSLCGIDVKKLSKD